MLIRYCSPKPGIPAPKDYDPPAPPSNRDLGPPPPGYGRYADFGGPPGLGRGGPGDGTSRRNLDDVLCFKVSIWKFLRFEY
jgi:cleavage and polyadenylation specificity factor subunit 4